MKTVKELVEQKSELIALKKAEIKTVKGGLTTLVDRSVVKSETTNKDSENTLTRTVVGNTYLWMDSHDDVHAKGVFSKSIKERQKDIFHLHDHEFKLTAKVGDPKKSMKRKCYGRILGLKRMVQPLPFNG